MSYIVCGWYTPDYSAWRDRLVDSLERFGIPHDIVEVPKDPRGWERNTMAKADQLKAAMVRHPNETIIFLDVDCEVCGPLDALADTKADVLVYMRPSRRKGRIKWGMVRSGTMVVRPTDGARDLVGVWSRLSRVAGFGAIDQDTLMLALVRARKAVFGYMPVEYCAVAKDRCQRPIILHDSASKRLRKVSKIERRLRDMIARIRWWFAEDADDFDPYWDIKDWKW